MATSSKPWAASARATGDHSDLVGVADAEERAAAGGKLAAGSALGPGEGGREVGAARHHLPGRAHLGAEHRVGTGEPDEREHRRLHVVAGAGFALRRKLELGERRSRREPAGSVDEVDPGRLGGVGNGARRARVHLEHVDVSAGDRELDVQQPDDPECGPEAADELADLRRVRRRRQHARGVARVDPRLLDVLHHGRDVRIGAVAEGVDVELDRALEEAVDEDDAVDRRHRGLDVRFAVTDAHRAAAEDVGGADEHRVADAVGDLDRLLGRLGHPPLRAAHAEALGEPAEALAVLGEVDGVERRPEDLESGALDRPRELQRRLAAELDADADRLLALEHREDGLLVERLEVEPVRRVVVGRDGLRVAVDHHGLVALRPEALGGVDAAVVELDPLADPVRAAAEDHDRAAGLRRQLVALAAGRVEVVRGRLDLAGARVDATECGDTGGDVALELAREPGVQAVRPPLGIDLEAAPGLGEGLGERAADAHRLADRLHLRPERPVGAGELLEGEARHLDDDVVERRLEARGRRAGQVVRDLVERVAHGEARRDLGDRVAGRLRRERRGARDARVHLDHAQLAGVALAGELDVRAARVDADGADDRDRGVAQLLVGLVRRGSSAARR